MLRTIFNHIAPLWGHNRKVLDMNNLIEVQIKNVYGNEVVYPLCFVGKSFALIAKTKTLTDETIQIMKELGYQFTVKSSTI